MQLNSMKEWVSWIHGLHPKGIDLGLDRVREVARRLRVLQPDFNVITVAGTNGKGSTVAGLEAMYLAAGYRVGSFTSPYLFRLNEEFHLLGREATDAEIGKAFAKVENQRGNVALTPFEFNTLAALQLFHDADLEIVILEVGLGGRLDAVNIMDPDIAVVTSIGMDHMNLLGDTREKIALEKAGIFRASKPAVCGCFDPPSTLKDYAEKIGALLYCQNNEFGFTLKKNKWDWWSQEHKLEKLPHSQLLLQNMATVLMVIELMQAKFPVSRAVIDSVLEKIKLPGRIQVKEQDGITQVYDVSHNPAAVAVLADYLKNQPVSGKTYAVFSMLADKDILGVIQRIKPCIDEWWVAPLTGERAATQAELQQYFSRAAIKKVDWCESIPAAYKIARQQAVSGDRIVVFGSFYTVAAVLDY